MELTPSVRHTLENVGLALIIILVGTGAFGLGRLSVEREGERVPAQVLDPSGEPAAAVSPASMSAAPAASGASAGGIIASKNGSKYYTEGCSGASRIADANKITFASTAEAEAAGYTKASACK